MSKINYIFNKGLTNEIVKNNIFMTSRENSSDPSTNIIDSSLNTFTRTSKGIGEQIDVSLNTHIDLSNIQSLVAFPKSVLSKNPTVGKVRLEIDNSNTQFQLDEIQMWVDNSNILPSDDRNNFNKVKVVRKLDVNPLYDPSFIEQFDGTEIVNIKQHYGLSATHHAYGKIEFDSNGVAYGSRHGAGQVYKDIFSSSLVRLVASNGSSIHDFTISDNGTIYTVYGHTQLIEHTPTNSGVYSASIINTGLPTSPNIHYQFGKLYIWKTESYQDCQILDLSSNTISSIPGNTGATDRIYNIVLDKFQNIYFSNIDKYRIEVLYQSGTVFGQTTDPSGNPWEVGKIYGVVNYSNNVYHQYWSYDNSAAADVRMQYPGQARFDLKGDLYFYKFGLNAATNLIRIDGQTSLAYRIWGEPLQQTSAVTTGNAARDTGMTYLRSFAFDLSGNLFYCGRENSTYNKIYFINRRENTLRKAYTPFSLEQIQVWVDNSNIANIGTTSSSGFLGTNSHTNLIDGDVSNTSFNEDSMSVDNFCMVTLNTDYNLKNIQSIVLYNGTDPSGQRGCNLQLINSEGLIKYESDLESVSEVFRFDGANISSVSTFASLLSNTNIASLDVSKIVAPSYDEEISYPTTMTGYRNSANYNKVYKMLITGASGSAGWGTGIYTDDSTISRAAVHAGAIAVGVTDYVYVKVLPGQSSYTGSTQNGNSSSGYGSWSGSYSFVLFTTTSVDVSSNTINATLYPESIITSSYNIPLEWRLDNVRQPTYSFDFRTNNNTTRIIDQMGTNLGITFENGVTFTEADGAFFSGGDDSTSPHANIDQFSLQTTITVELYFKLNTSSNYSRIFSFGDSTGSNNFLLARRSTNNYLAVYTNRSSWDYSSSYNQITNGTYMHVVVTATPSGGRIYTNNVEYRYSTTSNLIVAGTRNYNYLGRSLWGENNPNMNMLYFRIWNGIELNSTEVGDLYQNFNTIHFQGTRSISNNSIVHANNKNITSGKFTTYSNGNYVDIDISTKSVKFNDIQNIITYNYNTSSSSSELDLSNQEQTKIILYDENNIKIIEYKNRLIGDNSYNIYKYKGPDNESSVIKKFQKLRIETTDYTELKLDEVQLWVNNNNVIPNNSTITASSTYGSDVSSNVKDSNLSTYFMSEKGIGQYIDVSLNTDVNISEIQGIVLYSSPNNTNPKITKIRYETTANVSIEFNEFQLFTTSNQNQLSDISINTYPSSSNENFITDGNINTHFLSEKALGAYVDFSLNDLSFNYNDLQAIMVYNYGNSGNDLSNQQSTKLILYDDSNIPVIQYSNQLVGDISYNIYKYKGPSYIADQLRSIRIETTNFTTLDINEIQLWSDSSNILQPNSYSLTIKDSSLNTYTSSLFTDSNLNTVYTLEKGNGNYIDISLNNTIDLSKLESLVIYSDIKTTENPVISKLRFETTKNVPLQFNEIQIWKSNTNILKNFESKTNLTVSNPSFEEPSLANYIPSESFIDTNKNFKKIIIDNSENSLHISEVQVWKDNSNIAPFGTATITNSKYEPTGSGYYVIGDVYGATAPTTGGWSNWASNDSVFILINENGSLDVLSPTAGNYYNNRGASPPSDTFSSIFAHSSNIDKNLFPNLAVDIIPYDDYCDAFAGVTTTGELRCWGSFNNGDFDGLPTTNDFTGAKIVFTVNAACALKSDGSIATWGRSEDGGTGNDSKTANNDIPIDNGYTAIYASEDSFTAIKDDGTVSYWGHNSYNNISNNSGAPSSVGTNAKIAVNGGVFVALKSDGTLLNWGTSSYGGSHSELPSGNFTKIIAIRYGFVGLKNDGSLVGWGMNTSNLPTGTNYVDIIFVYREDLIFVKNDGTLVGWSGGTTHPSHSSLPTTNDFLNAKFVTNNRNNQGVAALKSDGTVVSWGLDSNLPSAPTDSGYTNIYATNLSFSALKSDGKITQWGSTEGNNFQNASNISFKGIWAWFKMRVTVGYYEYTPEEYKANSAIDNIINIGDFSQTAVYNSMITVDNSGTWQLDLSESVNYKDLQSIVVYNRMDTGGQSISDKMKTIKISLVDFSGRTINEISPNSINFAYKIRGGASETGYTSTESINYNANRIIADSVTNTSSNFNSDSTTRSNELFKYSLISKNFNRIIIDNSENSLHLSEVQVWKDNSNIALLGTAAITKSKYVPPPSSYYVVADHQSSFTSTTLGGWTSFAANLEVFTLLNEDGSLHVFGSDTNNGATPPTDTFSSIFAHSSNLDKNLLPNLMDNLRQDNSVAKAFAGVTTSGELKCWGSFDDGDFNGLPSTNDFTGAKIFFTKNAACALKSDGSIATWGKSGDGGTGNDNEEPNNDIPTDNGYTAVYASSESFTAIKDDGTVGYWGWASKNYIGSSGAPSTVGANAKIAVNMAAFVALKSDGTLLNWGASAYGGSHGGRPTGNFTKIVALRFGFVGLKTDGSLVGWGQNASNLPSGTNYVDIIRPFTDEHLIFIKSDGTLEGWSNGTEHYTVSSTNLPTDNGFLNAKIIGQGTYNGAVAALKSDGTVVSWGENYHNATAPTNNGYTDIFSSKYALFGLHTDGSITKWGVSSNSNFNSATGIEFSGVWSFKNNTTLVGYYSSTPNKYIANSAIDNTINIGDFSQTAVYNSMNTVDTSGTWQLDLSESITFNDLQSIVIYNRMDTDGQTISDKSKTMKISIVDTIANKIIDSISPDSINFAYKIKGNASELGYTSTESINYDASRIIADSVTNSSGNFNSDSVTRSNSVFVYNLDKSLLLTGWTSNDYMLLRGSNTYFGNQNITYGNQILGLRNNQSISKNISSTISGEYYRLEFYTHISTDTSNSELSVLLDSSQISSIIIDSSETSLKTAIFIASDTSHNIEFKNNSSEMGSIIWLDNFSVINFNNRFCDDNINTYTTVSQGLGAYFDIDLNTLNLNYQDMQGIVTYNYGNGGYDLSNQYATKVILYDDSNVPIIEYSNPEYVDSVSTLYNSYKYKGPDHSNTIKSLKKIRLEASVEIGINEIQVWKNNENVFKYYQEPTSSFILNGALRSLTDLYSSTTLTLVNSPGFDNDGVHLIGAQYITIPQSILGFGSDNFTISLWTQTSVASGTPHILSMGYDNTNSWLLGSDGSVIQLYGYQQTSTGDGDTDFNFTVDNQTNNYIISRVGNKMKLFINGVQKLDLDVSVSLPAQDYHIGYSLSNGSYYSGAIKRLDIWKNYGFSS